MTIIQRTIKIFSNLNSAGLLELENEKITDKLVKLCITSGVSITHESIGSNYHIMTISMDSADVPAVKNWLLSTFPSISVLNTILRKQRYNPDTQTTTITDTSTTF